jgi:hypothetical protein
MTRCEGEGEGEGEDEGEGEGFRSLSHGDFRVLSSHEIFLAQILAVKKLEAYFLAGGQTGRRTGIFAFFLFLSRRPARQIVRWPHFSQFT